MLHQYSRVVRKVSGAGRISVQKLVGGTGHYLNRSAEFATSVLDVIRAYTARQHVIDACDSSLRRLNHPDQPVGVGFARD